MGRGGRLATLRYSCINRRYDTVAPYNRCYSTVQAKFRRRGAMQNIAESVMRPVEGKPGGLSLGPHSP